MNVLNPSCCNIKIGQSLISLWCGNFHPQNKNFAAHIMLKKFDLCRPAHNFVWCTKTKKHRLFSGALFQNTNGQEKYFVTPGVAIG
jgi:hypothetical protein